VREKGERYCSIGHLSAPFLATPTELHYGNLDEFDRKLVRNDYLLLALLNWVSEGFAFLLAI